MRDLQQHLTAGRAIDAGIVVTVAIALLWMFWPALNSTQRLVAVPAVTLLSALWVFVGGWILHTTGCMCKRMVGRFTENVS